MLIGKNGVRLSGGERQRLAIARVILKNAPLLILDKATTNLDATTEWQIMQALEPFMANRMVILIAHRRLNLEGVEQIIQLENGRATVVGALA